MEVYAIPEDAPAAPDLSTYLLNGTLSYSEFEKAEERHRDGLVDWLKANGYGGKNTGGIYRTPHADSYAQYMLAEPTPGYGGRSCLIYLPYADAWHDPNVQYIPKKEVLARIKRDQKVRSMFAA